jgi:hypothetical protein
MDDILLGISKVLENKNMLKWFKFISQNLYAFLCNLTYFFFYKINWFNRTWISI